MVRLGTALRTLIFCGLVLSTLGFGKTNRNNTLVTYPSSFAISERLADLPLDLEMFPGREMPEPGPSSLAYRAYRGPWQLDPALQKEVLPEVGATQGVNFDGIAANGWIPSDSNMAVGLNQIGEIVNVEVAFYSKNGTLLSGPTNLMTLFAPLGGDCGNNGNDAIWDPIVLYDRQADRWVIAGIGPGNTFAECVAVSTTNDPTGSYALYSYSFGGTLNDYDKLSTWATASNSAYLATYNLNGGQPQLCGLDRTKMLVGDSSAAMLCKNASTNESSYLPSDMDGPTPPVDGTPGLFLTWQNNNPGELYLRTLTLNFASGTATLSNPTTINVANDNLACGNGGTCVPQPGVSQQLDTLGDRLMYRFAIRHFPDHDRAVVSHAVANGSQVAVRWYEIYDPAGNVTLNQQGTFAPDSTYRWMSSVAEDQIADIGLGYSTSSSSIYPSISFTGRVPSDPSGTMETEASILSGTGSQSGASRWGDYTAMQVDPADDCTFWYVDQYEQTTGSYNWSTHIGSFIFDACETPTFGLGANPNSLTIAQGDQGISTVTITDLNGFSGDVTLSASGVPSGVTAGFSPNPTSTTSTLTLTVGAGAATGTSTITITGVSGSITQNASLSLTVTASGPAVSLNPTSLTWGKVKVGRSGAAETVTVQNVGASTVDFTSITTTGDFARKAGPKKKDCGSTLAVGASCTVRVIFTPTQTGLRTGSLLFTDNAAGSPQSVALSGTGK